MFKYKHRIFALLNDDEKALEIFKSETENIEEKVSTKCAYSFMAGAVITALILGASLTYFSKDKGMFINNLMGALHGNMG